MAPQKKRGHPVVELVAGGTAGMFEALTCHPLDTIKVRMQLRARSARQIDDAANKAAQKALRMGAPEAVAAEASVAAAARAAGPAKELGFVQTGLRIIRRETPLGLYKGLGAVIAGITPKMALRFSTYEYLKRQLTIYDSTTGLPVPLSTARIFAAGVGAGITEAVVVVNPMEVVKIRLQAQSHSLADPVNTPRYKNAVHCAYTIVRTEGLSSLYRGVVLTAARQASNQGVNFTVYTSLRNRLEDRAQGGHIPSYQTSLIGLISGALGPLSNAPLDTIKTRMQRESGLSSESGLARFMRIARQLVREEGVGALYKGITPRVMRVAPGQAVTFTVYEYMRERLEKIQLFKHEPL